MPFCPECGYEYREGFSRCSDCGVTLVEDAPAGITRDAVPDDESELSLLSTFGTVAQAEMIQELLESNAIATVLRGDTDPIGVASGATPTAIFVCRADLDRAREIFDAYFAGEATPELDQSS